MHRVCNEIIVYTLPKTSNQRLVNVEVKFTHRRIKDTGYKSILDINITILNYDTKETINFK